MIDWLGLWLIISSTGPGSTFASCKIIASCKLQVALKVARLFSDGPCERLITHQIVLVFVCACPCVCVCVCVHVFVCFWSSLREIEHLPDCPCVWRRPPSDQVPTSREPSSQSHPRICVTHLCFRRLEERIIKIKLEENIDLESFLHLSNSCGYLALLSFENRFWITSVCAFSELCPVPTVSILMASW